MAKPDEVKGIHDPAAYLCGACQAYMEFDEPPTLPMRCESCGITLVTSTPILITMLMTTDHAQAVRPA